MYNLDVPEGVYNEDIRIKRGVLDQWAHTEGKDHYALYTPDLSDGYWSLRNANTNELICRFGLSALRGCFAAVVGHSLEVQEPYRNKGYATFILDFCLAAMQRAGYSLYIVTVRADNAPMLKVFEKYKFTNCFGFANHKNDSNILCLSKGLQ